MTEREILDDEQVVECRSCGSKWSVNMDGRILAVLLECPLCWRKQEGSPC